MASECWACLRFKLTRANPAFCCNLAFIWGVVLNQEDVVETYWFTSFCAEKWRMHKSAKTLIHMPVTIEM